MKKYLYFTTLCALTSMPTSYAMNEEELTWEEKYDLEEKKAEKLELEKKIAAYIASKNTLNESAIIPNAQFLAEKRGQEIPLKT
jgi:hypothetical protein